MCCHKTDTALDNLNRVLKVVLLRISLPLEIYLLDPIFPIVAYQQFLSLEQYLIYQAQRDNIFADLL